MKYSNVENTIIEKLNEMSKRFDKQIKDFNSNEEKILMKRFADIELENYRFKLLYDYAKYNESIPTIDIGKSELINSDIIRGYIHGDVLYCGMGVASYLKSIQDLIPCERINPHDVGSLYEMKIKCIGITRDELFYIDSETNEITKVKFEGIQ